MGSMGNIVLSGYYGFDNVGDEAVLYSIIKSLKKEIGNNIKITVLSNNPDKTASIYKVKAVNRWKLKQILSVLKEADLLISGGGSLLQDVTGRKSIPYYLSIIWLAKLFRKKVVFYAQGIGPVNIKLNRILIKWIVNKVDYISVRDRQSKEELLKMGIKNKAIDIVSDPVMELKGDHKVKKKEKKKRLGVYLRNWEVEDKFYEDIKDILNWFYKQGWKVVFIPMHYPDDIELAKEMSKEVPDSIVYEGKHLPQNILNLTGTMDYVIGMRLHSIIMAATAEVPYMALSYDPKVKSFVDAIQVGKVIDIHYVDKEEILSYLKHILNNLDEIKEEIKQRKNKLLDQQNKPIDFIKKIFF